MELNTTRHRSEVIAYIELPASVNWITPYKGYSTSSKSCVTDYSSASTYYYTLKALSQIKDCWDVPTRNFSRLQRQGRLIFNDFKTSLRTWESDGSMHHNIYKLDKYGCKVGGAVVDAENVPTINHSYSWRVPAPEPEDDLESEQNRLLISALDKVTASDAMVYATLGELNETIQGMLQVVSAVSGVLNAYKSDRFLSYLNRKRDIKTLRDIWMNIRYNLRPLYHDIKNYAAAFAEIRQGTLRQTFRDYKGYNLTPSPYVYTLGPDGMSGMTTFTETVVRNIGIRTGCLADIQVDIRSLLGFDRLFASAWELIPLSFIIDWFWNVGKIISALDPMVKRRVRGNWVTVEDATTKRVEITDYHLTNPAYSGSVSLQGFCQYSTVEKRRYCNEKPSYIPQLNIRLDAFKLLDITSILSQISSAKRSIMKR
jgi:hypothetical protein